MLEIKELKKQFKNNVLFENVNITFQPKQIYGFIGPNGCGKSIFFKTICGFIKADHGRVVYNQKVIGKDIDFIPSLGVLIEKPGFIENYTHIQNLEYLASINKTVDRKDIIDVLIKVGLDPNLKIKVSQFSLGMRQRLGIAQAIMENPWVLVLDEPFNGLDKDGVLEIKKIILSCKQKGMIVLLTSHIGGDIEELSDKVYEFSKNTIVEL